MSASGTVLQLVRAHYQSDESGFASAAAALARASKAPSVRAALLSAIQVGASRARQQPRQQFQPLRPPAPPAAANGILQPVDPVTFERLLLDPELQSSLDEFVLELEYREELAERRLRARNRLLFWGPPGNGKTACSSALANALDMPAFCVSLPDLISKYIGETGSNISQIFASLSGDTLVVFDEIDAIGAGRSSGADAAGKEFNGIVNSLLTLLDRHKDGIIVATTNRPDILDPALRRRFDEELFFPPPNDAQKRQLSERLCAEYEVPLVDVSTCANFDAVTKTVQREARRVVMQELLAAEAADEENEEDKP